VELFALIRSRSECAAKAAGECLIFRLESFSSRDDSISLSEKFPRKKRGKKGRGKKVCQEEVELEWKLIGSIY
jgi:hypothetical protein